MKAFYSGMMGRISVRFALIFVVSTVALYCFYNHYDPTRDPKTSTLIAAVVAGYDKLMKWWCNDHDAAYWQDVARQWKLQSDTWENKWKQCHDQQKDLAV